MAKKFLDENFLLQNNTACTLYHEYAEDMPIYDYHCHLPVHQIAQDIKFANLTQAWLYGDHYKWRAMRTNGIQENFCTGNASDKDKFLKWAQTVPYCLRNPLYHWTHLELKRYFDVNTLLNENTAEDIYNTCSEKLNTAEYSVRNLMRKMNVKLVCTTEDPLDSLNEHKQLAESDFEIAVHTAWRPDKAMAVNDLNALNIWINRLSELTDIQINNFSTYMEALYKRHTYFHEHGCRLSDHGLDRLYCEDYTAAEIEDIFQSILKQQNLNEHQQKQFQSAMLIEFARMDHARSWVQQFHIGALRNNNTRLFKQIGPDTGFDSIGDSLQAESLSGFLNQLDKTDQLCKTILYNLNPRDNELIATMTGNFQDGSVPGKIQFGSGWWFMDQKDGMERQINALSSLGLLSRFVGMLTDSRSFLSFPRHEYFRRILCNIIGTDVENGLLPDDIDLLGKTVKDICYNNAREYFPMKCS